MGLLQHLLNSNWWISKKGHRFPWDLDILGGYNWSYLCRKLEILIKRVETIKVISEKIPPCQFQPLFPPKIPEKLHTFIQTWKLETQFFDQFFLGGKKWSFSASPSPPASTLPFFGPFDRRLGRGDLVFTTAAAEATAAAETERVPPRVTQALFSTWLWEQSYPKNPQGPFFMEGLEPSYKGCFGVLKMLPFLRGKSDS